MPRIHVACRTESSLIPNERIREICRKVLQGEFISDYEISIAFVDNDTIHRLNKQFLDHDEPTDVLSFPLSGAGAKQLKGELVIGIHVAEREAAERGHSAAAELALYVIHGLLHLCGYDDHTEDDCAAMRERERHYLQAAGFNDIA